MGGASVASTSSVYSSYWNPAALLTLKSDAQFGAMHNENFGGISKYDYLGFATIKQGNSALGLSIVRNGVDGIPNTLNLIDNNGDVNYSNITTGAVSTFIQTQTVKAIRILSEVRSPQTRFILQEYF